uniref:Membrane transporter n=1 Tax=Pristionchus pacificus TaxID=54126 RepID=A0A2A6C1T1_PRIPA|eukprot:PDM72100.1 membrane transporter [Pristionchus pacificus]
MEDVDPVRDIGMPDRFTPYTFFLTVVLSLTWILAAIPAMVPAYVAPPASGGVNSSRIGDFYTVIDEFELSATTAEWTTMAYFLGSLLVGQIPCALSDKIGRKPVAFYSALFTGISGVIAALAPNYWIFLIGRFLQGAFFTATTNVNWVMVCESVPLSRHGRASIVFGVMWCTGYCIIAPIAILFPTWRQLFLVTSIPTIIYAFVMQYSVRESLSFLVIRRRRDEVEAWIQTAEKYGGVKVTHSFEGGCLDTLLDDRMDESPSRRSTYSGSSTSSEQQRSMKELTMEAFKDKKTLVYLLISIYMWITDFLVYNGLSLTSTGIKIGNPHWNYVMSGLVELPAAFVLPLLMDTIGRRATVILSHAETALALLALGFIPLENEILYMIVWLAAKFGTASSFIALYIYGSEIFHIKYRNICLGICCTLGNLGAMAAPYTAHLGVSSQTAVYSIYAALSLVSSGLDIFLPETMHLHSHRPIGVTQSPPIEA